jgi:hypothetical protein
MGSNKDLSRKNSASQLGLGMLWISRAVLLPRLLVEAKLLLPLLARTRADSIEGIRFPHTAGAHFSCPGAVLLAKHADAPITELLSKGLLPFSRETAISVCSWGCGAGLCRAPQLRPSSCGRPAGTVCPV